MLKRIAILLAALLAAVAATAPVLRADPPEHAGVGLYIVVLKNPRLVPNVAAEPDASAFGGALVKKAELRRLMRIPDARIEALRRHPAVSFIQRVNTGAPGSDQPLPPMPRLEGDDSGSGAWAAPTWFSGEYRYDTAGNIASIGAPSAIHGDGKPTLNSDGKANTYAYDSAERLVRATVSHGTDNVETYTYDSFGNLTSKQTNGAMAMAIAIAANPNTNRLNGSDYDHAGNLTGVSGTTVTPGSYPGHTFVFRAYAGDEKFGHRVVRGFLLEQEEALSSVSASSSATATNSGKAAIWLSASGSQQL